MILRRYVEGLVAAMQKATGKPVMAPRDRDDVYDPHLPGNMGTALRIVVDSVQPKVTGSELAYWVCETRKKYAGKPMRFLDMYPAYDATVEHQTGVPMLRPPLSLSGRQSRLLFTVLRTGFLPR